MFAHLLLSLGSAYANLIIRIFSWTGIPALASKTASQTASQTRSLVHFLLLALLTLLVVLTTSFFLYATFYYAYMPAKLFEEELSIQFSSCPTSPGQCTYPNATVKIDPKRFRLVPGQSYSVGVTMELPHSPVNKELGMFLSCLQVISSGKMVNKVCRSSILEFRSNMLRVLDDLILFPFLVFGSHVPRQNVKVLYYRDFIDDSYNPAEEMVVEIQSNFIQIYSSKLEIHAQFSGLRHVMHQFPISSSLIGINSVIIILSTIIFISWSRFRNRHTDQSEEIVPYLNGDCKKYLEDEDENVKNVK
eukprot:GFUD01014838.1.p1 GENE.GFUD01014838.1~~GFUD01014838.1.p1  ORF type:complete len:330 (+),score=89.62 GFUD01014838.1:81-992(+)